MEIKLSYSKLSEFDRKGPGSLVDNNYGDTKATTIGGLVNDLVFKNVNLEDVYFFKRQPDPTATTLKLAKIIVDNYIDIPEEEEILKIIERNEFWKATKDREKMVSNYSTLAFWEFLEVHMGSKDKLIVSPEMNLQAEELAYILTTHRYSRDYFNGRKTIKSELRFEIDYLGVVLRGFVDMVEIDHENKTFRIIDLKTGVKTCLEFTRSFIEWRYYLQSAVYTLAADYIAKELDIEGYTLLPFQFLYIGKTEKLPVIINVSDIWKEAGIKGFTTSSGYTYKGVDELIKQIKFHHHFKRYDEPYEVLINEGVMNLYDNIHVE